MRLIAFRAALLGLALVGAAPAAEPELAYSVSEGQNLNLFLRDGPVAAHTLLRSGEDPRILVAFPAGNSGVGLWFDKLERPARWTLGEAPKPVTISSPRGALHGVRLTASIDAPRLTIKQAVLTNVRYLRDYQGVGRFPPETAVTPTFKGQTIDIRRARLDGAPGYALTLRVTEGRIADRAILASPAGRIGLEIVALTGDPPVHGLREAELLNAGATADPAARNALRFLSYREKFLAGSWRFNTYFGRDTLMSLRLLMPALQPAAIEAGLDAVLARVSDKGEVAHEEAIGEFAILDHKAKGQPAKADPAVLDYEMVDSHYMLAPVAAHYLLAADPAAARRFLSRELALETRAGARASAGAQLVRNLRLVTAAARPFADAPRAGNLIAILPHKMQGQWRDSDEGIGRGRFAYDVNAVFVPAALRAADGLLRAGLLDPYLTPADRAAFAGAGAMARVWGERAEPLFRVSLPAAQARPAIAAYAQSLGVPSGPALTALGDAKLIFHAIALNADGTPVPIIHSDEAFALLFGEPSPEDVQTYVTAIMRPFPAGLMTDIGLLVANPALDSAAAQARFSPAAYHGVVVWSWQQALLAAGLERQLARGDLPAPVRATLTRAQTDLWRVIRAARAVQSSELWSWEYRDGAYRVVAFGAGKRDVDESNAAQLWSTVYLAVQPPRAK